MLKFSLKSLVMQKCALQFNGEFIFQSKVILLFLPKCSKLHHSELFIIISWYTVYLIIMEVTVDFLPYNGRDC